MITVSSADRVVFPEVGRTKGEVVSYFEKIAPKMLPHLFDRPLSVKRYPKGLAGQGFFQKNFQPHYPETLGRFTVPRSPRAAKTDKADAADEVTIYPIVTEAEHLAFFANQGAIELHVPTSRASSAFRPDRIVFDLDPPLNAALPQVRSAARQVRSALGELGLESALVATGSKGYHVIANIEPALAPADFYVTLQKAAELFAHRHPDELTTAFRIVQRKKRVFVDWLRNFPMATVVAPYSLRARPRAAVAAPLAWHELETHPPDAFTIADVDRLLDRPDALLELPAQDARPFASAVEEAYARAGLTFVPFDRFRS